MCFLTGRTQHIGDQRVKSSAAKLVLQKSPFIFMDFLNNIPDTIKQSNIKPFTEDARIQKVDNKVFDRPCLQSDPLVIIQWLENNKILLNDRKFVLIRFVKEDILKPHRIKRET